MYKSVNFHKSFTSNNCIRSSRYEDGAIDADGMPGLGGQKGSWKWKVFVICQTSSLSSKSVPFFIILKCISIRQTIQFLNLMIENINSDIFRCLCWQTNLVIGKWRQFLLKQEILYPQLLGNHQKHLTSTIIFSPGVRASELFADLSSRIVEFVWCRALLGLHSQTLHWPQRTWGHSSRNMAFPFLWRRPDLNTIIILNNVAQRDY